MDQHHSDAIGRAASAYSARQYARAASEAELLLRSFDSEPHLAEAAKLLLNQLQLGLIVGNVAEARAADGVYQCILPILELRLGQDHEVVNEARAQMANVFALQGRPKIAAEFYRQALEGLERRFGRTHPQTHGVRNNLAIQFRNLGDADSAAALFAGNWVCEHLRPVEEYLHELGLRIATVSTPWTLKCRTWVYFENVLLDPEALIRRFGLPDLVTPHTYLDPRVASEQGIVCRRDHDALVGIHPASKSGARVIR